MEEEQVETTGRHQDSPTRTAKLRIPAGGDEAARAPTLRDCAMTLPPGISPAGSYRAAHSLPCDPPVRRSQEEGKHTHTQDVPTPVHGGRIRPAQTWRSAGDGWTTCDPSIPWAMAKTTLGTCWPAGRTLSMTQLGERSQTKQACTADSIYMEVQKVRTNAQQRKASG